MPKNGLAIEESGDGGGQLRAVADGENLLHGGLDRRGAFGVQTHRVEAHLVEVGDLLFDGARGGRRLGHLGEELVDARLVVVAQDVERSVARVFGFQGIVFLPAARGVLVEIGVGGYRKVEVGHVDRRGLRGILAGYHTGHCCCEEDGFFHIVRVFKERGPPDKPEAPVRIVVSRDVRSIRG